MNDRELDVVRQAKMTIERALDDAMRAVHWQRTDHVTEYRNEDNHAPV